MFDFVHSQVNVRVKNTPLNYPDKNQTGTFIIFPLHDFLLIDW